MEMFQKRISQRFPVDLPVLACNVIESRSARIVDLSMHGAKVESKMPYPQGQMVALEFQGERIFGVVSWAEIDRMGVKFIVPIKDGAFRAALDAADGDGGLPAAGTLQEQQLRPVFGRRAVEP